jgi:hypothetical protein
MEEYDPYRTQVFLCFFVEDSTFYYGNQKVQIDFLTNSDHRQDCSGLVEKENEALSVNKMIQTVYQHLIDILSVNHVELRHYILHHFI